MLDYKVIDYNVTTLHFRKLDILLHALASFLLCPVCNSVRYVDTTLLATPQHSLSLH